MPDNNTRHTSRIALVLIDVINHFDFPDGDKLLKRALPMAARLAGLKQRCRSAGRPFVEQLRPDDEDYLVPKPMHSAFFQTPVEILVQYLGATSLILTGLETNSCIVCTAPEANLRNFSLYIPSDCSAARSRSEHAQAIEHIEEMASASIVPSAKLSVDALRAANRKDKTQA
jgi:nicotinamidase-related amidase